MQQTLAGITHVGPPDRHPAPVYGGCAPPGTVVSGAARIRLLSRSPHALVCHMNFDGMWAELGSDPREALESGRGEKAVLAEYLDRYRMTFELKWSALMPSARG